MKSIAKIILMIIFLMPTVITAETIPKINLKQFLATKRTVVKETILLTEKESGIFWALYDDYEKTRIYILNRYDALIRQYMQEHENLSESKAEEMINMIQAIQTEDLETRRTYFKKLSEKLPLKKVFQYLIFEETIEAGFNANIVKKLPPVK